MTVDESRGIIKSIRREKKRRKAQHGMRVSGRSLISVILPAIAKKGRDVSKTYEETKEKEKKTR